MCIMQFLLTMSLTLYAHSHIMFKLNPNFTFEVCKYRLILKTIDNYSSKPVINSRYLLKNRILLHPKLMENSHLTRSNVSAASLELQMICRVPINRSLSKKIDVNKPVSRITRFWVKSAVAPMLMRNIS